uniref:SH2 domain-containing protein n=1 Tax=Astyanax mexicanus TaxID=7994 RepID=A0A8B9GPI9_ASTMX
FTQSADSPAPMFNSRLPGYVKTDEGSVRSLEEASWFVGNLSRAEAEELLDGKPSGAFLIRSSGTRKDCYACSVVYVYIYIYMYI